MPVKGWVPVGIRRAVTKDFCERCGSESRRLDIHHGDGDRTNNSPENLWTLCPSCHTALHWETGKQAWRRHSPTCTVCGKPAKRLGLCETHRSRLMRHGSPYLVKRQIGGTWQLTEDRGPENGPESQESAAAYRNASTDLGPSETRSSRKSSNTSGGASSKRKG